jgi:hypothetical protein
VVYHLDSHLVNTGELKFIGDTKEMFMVLNNTLYLHGVV